MGKTHHPMRIVTMDCGAPEQFSRRAPPWFVHRPVLPGRHAVPRAPPTTLDRLQSADQTVRQEEPDGLRQAVQAFQALIGGPTVRSVVGREPMAVSPGQQDPMVPTGNPYRYRPPDTRDRFSDVEIPASSALSRREHEDICLLNACPRLAAREPRRFGCIRAGTEWLPTARGPTSSQIDWRNR